MLVFLRELGVLAVNGFIFIKFSTAKSERAERKHKILSLLEFLSCFVFLSELGVLAVKDGLKDKEPYREDGKDAKKAEEE